MNRKPLVLIVDDEDDTVDYLKVLLSKYDYRLLTAASGKETITILKENPQVDVILLDIMMPEVDGYEVLDFIKNNYDTQNCRVIMLTALDQVEDKIKAFELGAADYVSKPFNMLELQARVKTQVDLKIIEEDVRESESRFRNMADFTYDWEYWLNPKGGMVYSSPSCERITGYSAEEFSVTPQLIEEMVHPDDRSRILKYFSKKPGKKDIQELTFRIIDRKGEIHWIGHQCRGVYAENGEYLGKRVSNRDITEQKQSEEAYHTLVENSIQELLIFQDGRVVFANPAAAEMSDFSREELTSMTPDEVIEQMHPEDRKVFGELIQKRLSGRLAPARYEFRTQRKDGSQRWIEMLATYIMYQGKPAIQVAQVDISDRKMAEDALKRSEMLYRATINTLEEIIYVLDEEMRFVLYNRAFIHWCQQQSVVAEDILGMKFFDIFPFLREKIESELEQIFKSGKQITKIETMEIAGREMIISTRTIPIFIENKVVYLVSIIHEAYPDNRTGADKG